MDVWVEFKNATKIQAEGLFRNFFPCAEDVRAKSRQHKNKDKVSSKEAGEEGEKEGEDEEKDDPLPSLLAGSKVQSETKPKVERSPSEGSSEPSELGSDDLKLSQEEEDELASLGIDFPVPPTPNSLSSDELTAVDSELSFLEGVATPTSSRSRSASVSANASAFASGLNSNARSRSVSMSSSVAGAETLPPLPPSKEAIALSSPAPASPTAGMGGFLGGYMPRLRKPSIPTLSSMPSMPSIPSLSLSSVAAAAGEYVYGYNSVTGAPSSPSKPHPRRARTASSVSTTSTFTSTSAGVGASPSKTKRATKPSSGDKDKEVEVSETMLKGASVYKPLTREELGALAKKFADGVPEEEFSVASLQGCEYLSLFYSFISVLVFYPRVLVA
jgi:hypothetical protein